MRILLAISHSDPRLSLEILLSQEPGLSIVGTTGDMESLLALIQTSRPDLVVLDWDLPGARPAPLALLKAQRRSGRPQFLVLGRKPELKQQVLAAGAHAFVAIGDPPEKLLATVRQVRASLSTKNEHKR